MSGYLGTLFMANVGMRLLMPPKSQFAQASSRFGGMLKGIGQEAYKYTRSSGQIQRDALRKSLSDGLTLNKQMNAKNKAETTKSLKNTLDAIAQMENSKIEKVGDKYKAVNDLGNPKSRGYQPENFFKKQRKIIANYTEGLGKAAKTDMANFVGGMVAIGDSVSYVGNVAFASFRGAITTSVTLLTTFGYMIRGLTQEFGMFEKELINANSIWMETNETLYSISDQVVKFGEDYGVAYSQAASSLYQFASAGLDAAESQKILTEVLTLAMAVQGDANTIGKLTVQTVKGFGLEMDQAGVVTDKFAHAINASLIEYQDLASAIKFALPFFTATNQNLDQLLGSIQVLTNRALEAGIAGRGLRQALAEFAEGAQDSTRKFAEMGVKVVDAQGNFLKLTEIARNFSNAVGSETAGNVELLTSLIDDLNIRGATAFIHLVQNVDEFEAAVNDLSNAQGASKKMADIQQDSLVMQIQLLKNAAKEVFYLSDATYVAQGYMNEFDYVTKSIVRNFREAFIVEMADGSKKLTEFGFNLREAVIIYMKQFQELSMDLIESFAKMANSGFNLGRMMKMVFYPFAAVVSVMTTMDELLGKIGGDGLLMKFYFMSMMFGRTAGFIIMMVDGMTELTRMLTGSGEGLMKIIGIASMYYGGGIMLKGGKAIAGTAGGKAFLARSGLFKAGQKRYVGQATAGLSGKALTRETANATRASEIFGGKAAMYAGGAVAGYGANTYLQAGDNGMGQTYQNGNNGYGAYNQLYIENATMNSTNMNDTFYVAGLNQ